MLASLGNCGFNKAAKCQSEMFFYVNLQIVDLHLKRLWPWILSIDIENSNMMGSKTDNREAKEKTKKKQNVLKHDMEGLKKVSV